MVIFRNIGYFCRIIVSPSLVLIFLPILLHLLRHQYLSFQFSCGWSSFQFFPSLMFRISLSIIPPLSPFTRNSFLHTRSSFVSTPSPFSSTRLYTSSLGPFLSFLPPQPASSALLVAIAHSFHPALFLPPLPSPTLLLLSHPSSSPLAIQLNLNPPHLLLKPLPLPLSDPYPSFLPLPLPLSFSPPPSFSLCLCLSLSFSHSLSIDLCTSLHIHPNLSSYSVVSVFFSILSNFY